MSAIQISPPCTEEFFQEHKGEGLIVRPDKFVARESLYGPYGYGDTAEEAFHDLVDKLHAQINNHVAALYKENGCLDKHLGFKPRKYVLAKEGS